MLETLRRNAFAGTDLRLAKNGGSSIHQALVISYIVGAAGLDKSVDTLCLMSAVVVDTIMVPIASRLTDHFGGVLAYRSLAIFQLSITFPVWWFSSHGNASVTIVSPSLALGIGAWGMFGVRGAFLPELFGVRRRYIGIALAREASAVIVGGIAPLIGSVIISWMTHINDPSGTAAWMPIVIYLSLPTVSTIIVTFSAPETCDRDLDDLADAGTISVSQHNQTTGTPHDV